MEESPEVEACTRCDELVESRSRIVNGTGPMDVELLFVGEAPGEQEDAAGEPFVGRSGDVLSEVLATHRVDRDDVRITNCVRCRPPENRDPQVDELANCRPYLEREIAIVEPTLIVALGKVPAEHLLDRDVAVTKEAGSIETVELGERPRDVLVAPHPAATLYDPSQRPTFEAAIEAAVDRGDVGGDQSSLDDF
ncbi:MAG: uracil-DNA glycosylase family protein [Halobacteriaceae archaeon]